MHVRFWFLHFNITEWWKRERRGMYYDLVAPRMIMTHQSIIIAWRLFPKREAVDGSFGSKRNETERIDERISRWQMRASFCRVARSIELDHTFSLGWLTYWHWHCGNVTVEKKPTRRLLPSSGFFCGVIVGLTRLTCLLGNLLFALSID
jgi:hypothetical protein